MDKHQQIPTLSLKNTEKLPVPFVIDRMQEMETRRDQNTVRIPHRHDFYSIIWIRKGFGSHTIDFVEYPVKGDQLFFISPGQVHSLDLEMIMDGIVILFTEDFLCQATANSDLLSSMDFFQHFDNHPISVPEEYNTGLQQATEMLFFEHEKGLSYQKELIYAYLRVFLLQCMRLKELQKEDQAQPLNKAQEIWRHFRELVEKEYRKAHKVKDYADKINITPNHLNDMIKLQTGKTAKEIIQNRITLEAKRNAYYTDCNLKEITYFLGFEDPAHFSKFFKKQTGTTFQDFREQVRHHYAV